MYFKRKIKISIKLNQLNYTTFEMRKTLLDNGVNFPYMLFELRVFLLLSGDIL